MVSLFSGGWGPGFAPVVQVEYRGDGDGDMAGFCGGEVQVLQRGGRWAYLKSNNVTLLSLGVGNNTGGIVIYGKGDDVYGDDCHDLYGNGRYDPYGDEDESDLSSGYATK
ncbi:hypothetical protein ACQJBY_029318 [Aegilops geniculata]